MSFPLGNGQVGSLSAQTKTYVLSAPLEPPTNNGLRLRIVHAAHSTAVVDVYIDERLVASRLNYGDFTEYLGLADYSHTITIRRFGDNPNDPNVKPLARGSLTRTNQNSKQIDYTLLLVNSDAQNTAAIQSLAASNTSAGYQCQCAPHFPDRKRGCDDDTVTGRPFTNPAWSCAGTYY